MAIPTEHNPWAPPQSSHPATSGSLKQAAWSILIYGAGLWFAFRLIEVLEWGGLWPLTVPVGLFGLMLIANAALIHQTSWIAIEPSYEPFDPAQTDTPPEVAQLFLTADQDLERLGFTRELLRRILGSNPNVIGFAALYRNRQSLEQVKLVGAVGQNKLSRLVGVFQVCTTEFADGAEVVTSNRTTAKMLPNPPPPYYPAVVPEVTDAAHLLRAHRAHVAEHEAGRIRVDPIGAEPEGSLRLKDYQRFLDQCLACGYTWVDEAAGRHRYTWKGATLAAWKLSPPIKQIRLALERRAGRRHLARLEGR